MLNFQAITSYLPTLGKAIALTLEFTFTVDGSWDSLPETLLSLIKISRVRALQIFAQAYTSVFRGTPLLVQLMLIYYATPQLLHVNITALQAGVLTFGLNSAAYISESIRGGIQSVSRGQWEAAMSLGVPKWRMMVNIIFPQALKSILPSLINESIALLKDSSMVSIIGWRLQVLDIAVRWMPFRIVYVAALVYYVLVMGLTAIGRRIERRSRVSD